MRSPQFHPAAIVAFAILAAGTAARGEMRWIEFGGAARSYILFVPNRVPASAQGRPLIVALHGGGGTAAQMQRYIGLDAVAARAGIAIVYPQGTARRWNDGRLFHGRGETDADDVGFVRAVVAAVARTLPI
ncbi:MAG: hypothetical protein KIT16_09790, partial [Rhodospirillaceae bacterium]|nr:hypothetical protein [Rhodospirillaceae bacterium]